MSEMKNQSIQPKSSAFSQKINVGDIDLFIKVHGSNLENRVDPEQATLIFNHGGPGMDHTMHEAYWCQFAKAGIQVILPDLRGTGQSEYGDKEKWTLKQWGQDVHSLKEMLGIKTLFVGGMSAGGYVSYSYAAQYPNEAAGIIICNAEPYNSLARILEGYRRNVAKAGGDVEAAVEGARQMFTNATAESVSHYFKYCIPYAGFPNPPKEHAEKCIQNPEMSNWFYSKEFFGFNFLPELPKIQCPVLILASDGSPVHPVEASREAAEAIKPELLHYHEFLDTGCELYSFHPEAVYKIAVDFIHQYS